LADELGINLVYIPPYSPNLNLIERFWKHTKSKLRTKYYDIFSEFTDTIDSIIQNAGTIDKAAVDKLIGERVQLFPYVRVNTTRNNKTNRTTVKRCLAA